MQGTWVRSLVQANWCATATEPTHLEPVIGNRRNTAVRSPQEQLSFTATRELAHAAAKTQQKQKAMLT